MDTQKNIKQCEMCKDEEAIKKENININKEFDLNSQKIINLKDKIENEIIDIDKLYEKVEKEIIEYYKRKHEELIKISNNVKCVILEMQ